MRKDRLTKALETIKANPEKLNTGHWVVSPECDPQSIWLTETVIRKALQSPTECLTSMCLAGWFVHLAYQEGHPVPELGVGAQAMEYLEVKPFSDEAKALNTVFWSTEVETVGELEAILIDYDLL